MERRTGVVLSEHVEHVLAPPRQVDSSSLLFISVFLSVASFRQPACDLAVRGGGHSVAGHSTSDNGIVIVFYRAADAAKILPRWRDYCLNAPDEVTSLAVAITMPAAPTLPPAIHNQACLVIGGVYVGGAEQGMKVMQPLRELGTPLADISQPMPFHAVQTAFDPLFPMGKLQSYWKAQNLASLPDWAIGRQLNVAQPRLSSVEFIALI